MSYIIFMTGLSARDAGRTGIFQLPSMSFVFFTTGLSVEGLRAE
jgi:hypothetical protein